MVTMIRRKPVPKSRRYIRRLLNFEPTGPVQEAILDSDGTRLALKCAEQWGKSTIAAQTLVERMPEYRIPGHYWLAGERYIDTEHEYEYILQKLLALGETGRGKYSTAAPDKYRRIETYSGTVIETISVAESTNIQGRLPDGILGCEAGKLPYTSYLRLYGRATHGFLFLGGTAERTQPWFEQLHRSWSLGIGNQRAYTGPRWDNLIMYPGGRDDPAIRELEEVLPPETFRERVGGEAVARVGEVFGKDFKMDLHVGAGNGEDVEFLPDYPVRICVDPGYSESVHALLAVQMPPDQPIRVFDEIYLQRFTTRRMIEAAMSKPWWKQVTGPIVLDIAATRHLQADEPPSMKWHQITGHEIASNFVQIPDGIELLQFFFQRDPVTSGPKIQIGTKCKGLLSELGAEISPITGKMNPYRYGEDREGDTRGRLPIDRYNHSIKALTYLLYQTHGHLYGARKRESAFLETKLWS